MGRRARLVLPALPGPLAARRQPGAPAAAVPLPAALSAACDSGRPGRRRVAAAGPAAVTAAVAPGRGWGPRLRLCGQEMAERVCGHGSEPCVYLCTHGCV